MPSAEEIERLIAEMSAVWRLAVHLCEVRHAETLVQEAFQRAFRASSTLKLVDAHAARLYLFTVLHQIIVEREASLFAHADKNEFDLPNGASETSIAVAAESQSDLDARLQAAICHLPYLHREVFLLSVVEKLRYADIGQITGASAEMVAARLNEARLAVAARLLHLPPPVLPPDSEPE